MIYLIFMIVIICHSELVSARNACLLFSCHSELVSESPDINEKTLKQVQGDKALKNYFQVERVYCLNCDLF